MNAAADSDFLARMSERSRARAEAARRTLPEAELMACVRDLPPPPPLQLSPAGFDLLAEVKRRSPAEGQLAGRALDPVAQAGNYCRAGAAAVSVLTEPEAFRGSLDDLTGVAAAIAPHPAMRKDFLVDPYQLLEARVAGAGGALLVAACFDRDGFARMLEQCLALGLFALVEIFAVEELAHCLPAMEAAGPAIGDDGSVRLLLGVNCRDLRTLAVAFDRFAALAPALPQHWPLVAESGVGNAAEAAAVAAAGYRVALVGSALMRADDPAALARELLAAGRAAAA